jgi:L-amino acid N-acyltransferase YncA
LIRTARPPSAGNPVIRRATPDDAEGIMTLLSTVAAEGTMGPDLQLHDAETERRLLAAASPSVCWVGVAEDGGAVVGHALAVRGTTTAASHVATVAVAVAADRRGRGLAGRLLDGIVAWARDSGVSKLQASVLAGNSPALRLFEGRGFVREGVRRDQWRIRGVWTDEVLLARFLV